MPTIKVKTKSDSGKLDFKLWINTYPLVVEIVNIASHGGQMFYYSPLNLRNNVNIFLGDDKI